MSTERRVALAKTSATFWMGAGLFLCWLLAVPQALGYHEQYQLFLLTGDYLVERLAVAGGLAAWLGECCVQFFAVPWAGAAILALLFVALQQAGRSGRHNDESWTAFILSFLAPFLMFIHMGDPETLPTFLVALILSLACRRLPARLLLALFPLLWWALGPVAWVAVPVALAALPKEKRGLRIVHALGGCVLATALLATLFLRQYPVREVAMGIDYYRLPMTVPALQVVIALVAAFLPWLQRLTGPRWSNIVLAVVLLAAGAWGSARVYRQDYWRQIKCDQLVRQNRWDDLLTLYKGKRPADDYIAECLNLALAMKGELGERMYFTGEGSMEALARPYENNCFALLPSAEVFFRCGMVNEALRYFYDTQEAILNCRKSGRCTQRMVECYVIDGRYDVARKHLERLKHTLFYRRWAQEMELFCGDDALVESHPVYGRMRQLRSERDFLFNYDELYKMFGLLYLHDKSNTLALEYYIASCRLLGIQP